VGRKVERKKLSMEKRGIFELNGGEKSGGRGVTVEWSDSREVERITEVRATGGNRTPAWEKSAGAVDKKVRLRRGCNILKPSSWRKKISREKKGEGGRVREPVARKGENVWGAQSQKVKCKGCEGGAVKGLAMEEEERCSPPPQRKTISQQHRREKRS